jgi:hypothetical protein
MTKRCRECGQPMLPKGRTKKPNEYDHASGCPAAEKSPKKEEGVTGGNR